MVNLNFKQKLAAHYNSKTQVARVLTEDWVLREIYCPSCGDKLQSYTNNTPVADFYFVQCNEDYELKSKAGKIGNKVSAGAYTKMIERINSVNNPNFFFLSRKKFETVSNFIVIPKYFFVEEIIEERKPLNVSARRAGWVGSNILFSKIPEAGQIYYIKDGKQIPKEKVLEKWKKTVFLKTIKRSESKGWILDIMNCIDKLDEDKFTLTDMYTFENILQEIHPGNKNIKPKIRQQLQLLRDRGYLEFLGNGAYRLS